eukprot:CAMPEP_0117671142 /NCGR_PEP_ID=MMETSP0804-20121206/13165_1 /TAXON_ID=1074897 /ORGANISM="Tetraselmis astigmatica, Strain CCMP880" /LENGTH=530 /DNA_ID=CAMNT_0005479561 /DNA_START=26 /DNA_END=1618 /DNA_ORIENTATION=+
MGSGRDKRKKAKGHVPGKGAEKTERKTEKNEKKAQRRVENTAKDEDDIDSLLAQFKMADQQKTKVAVKGDVPPPSARVNASLTAYCTQRTEELILFGGERLDGNKVFMFNDLYRYNCKKDSWTLVSSPNTPPPRSAHQAVVYKSFLFVLGGEFTSPNQEKFYHYKDLWRLDLNTNEWENLPLKKGPSARSGHRVVMHKGRLILFGGYYDVGAEMKYYNDLWVLDIDNLQWNPAGDPFGPTPSPRSGCQMVVHGDLMYMHGGYSKVKDEDEPDMEHGSAHDDTWVLDLTNFKWAKVKKAGFTPSARAGFSMVLHKNRAVLFGGVSDHESKGGETLVSEFYNDMFTLNFANRRWFPLALRTAKGTELPEEISSDAPASGSSDTASGRDGSGSQASKGGSLHKAAVKIQSHYRGFAVRKAYKVYRLGGKVSEILYSPAQYGVAPDSGKHPKPRERINAAAAVTGNTMWLFGGIVEIGDKEITLDDLWSLDLNKLQQWNLVKEVSVPEQEFKTSAYESSNDGDADEEGDEEEDT